jgi:hypothetical protein
MRRPGQATRIRCRSIIEVAQDVAFYIPDTDLMTEPAATGGLGDAVIAVIVAGATIPLGPDYGPIAGAALTPVVQSAADRIRRWCNCNIDAMFAAAVAERDVELERLLGDLLRTDALRMLLASAVSAAEVTAVRAKLDALGRALARGAFANDDALIDEQQLVVRALADIEAVHLRVLEHLSAPIQIRDFEGELSPPMLTGYAESGIRSQHGAGIEAVLAALQSNGLARTSGNAVEILQRPTNDVAWVITPFGQQLLAELAEAGTRN